MQWNFHFLLVTATPLIGLDDANGDRLIVVHSRHFRMTIDKSDAVEMTNANDVRW